MKLIKLSQGLFATVDDTDYEYLMQWKWFAMKVPNTFYAARNNRVGNKVAIVCMHRQLLNVVDRKSFVDHKNHNGLDNTRNNLRVCSNKENMQNLKNTRNGKSSIYKGVSFSKGRNVWKACIKENKKSKHLGSFQHEQDAAQAYNVAARQLFGEYACLNEI